MEFKLNLITPSVYSRSGPDNCIDEAAERFAEYVKFRADHEFNMPCKYNKVPGLAFIHRFEEFEERFLTNSEYAVIIASPLSQKHISRFVPRLLVFLSMKGIWQNRFIFVQLGDVKVEDIVVHAPIKFSFDNWRQGDEESWTELFGLVKVRWVPYRDPVEETESSKSEISIDIRGSNLPLPSATSDKDDPGKSSAGGAEENPEKDNKSTADKKEKSKENIGEIVQIPDLINPVLANREKSGIEFIEDDPVNQKGAKEPTPEVVRNIPDLTEENKSEQKNDKENDKSTEVKGGHISKGIEKISKEQRTEDSQLEAEMDRKKQNFPKDGRADSKIRIQESVKFDNNREIEPNHNGKDKAEIRDIEPNKGKTKRDIPVKEEIGKRGSEGGIRQSDGQTQEDAGTIRLHVGVEGQKSNTTEKIEAIRTLQSDSSKGESTGNVDKETGRTQGRNLHLEGNLNSQERENQQNIKGAKKSEVKKEVMEEGSGLAIEAKRFEKSYENEEKLKFRENMTIKGIKTDQSEDGKEEQRRDEDENQQQGFLWKILGKKQSRERSGNYEDEMETSMEKQKTGNWFGSWFRKPTEKGQGDEISADSATEKKDKWTLMSWFRSTKEEPVNYSELNERRDEDQERISGQNKSEEEEYWQWLGRLSMWISASGRYCRSRIYLPRTTSAGPNREYSVSDKGKGEDTRSRLQRFLCQPQGALMVLVGGTLLSPYWLQLVALVHREADGPAMGVVAALVTHQDALQQHQSSHTSLQKLLEPSSAYFRVATPPDDSV